MLFNPVFLKSLESVIETENRSIIYWNLSSPLLKQRIDLSFLEISRVIDKLNILPHPCEVDISWGGSWNLWVIDKLNEVDIGREENKIPW